MFFFLFFIKKKKCQLIIYLCFVYVHLCIFSPSFFPSVSYQASSSETSIWPHKLLVSGDGVVKLADVGASVLSHAGDGEMNARGTPVCMAPELFQVQQTCLLHCDVDQWVAIVICCFLLFSFLVLLFENILLFQ